RAAAAKPAPRAAAGSRADAERCGAAGGHRFRGRPARARPVRRRARVPHSRRRLPGRRRARERLRARLPGGRLPRVPLADADSRDRRRGRDGCRRLHRRGHRLAPARVGLPAQLRPARHDRQARVRRQHPVPERRLGARGQRGLRPPLQRVPRRARRPAQGAVRMSYLPYALAVWIFAVGLYGVVRSRNLVHLVVCLSVAQSSTYVLLLSIGYVNRGTAPIFADVPKGTRAVDPVVQALTLTDVVVSVTVAALLLALAIQAQRHADTTDPDELSEMHGGWPSFRW